ncbi:hypothetical protein EVAR_66881_1 [Eumeta japonica]|uniref:Uncharacterized protein n=1 Tax=Eumeta variegata TaxID=151549 RepID=A0A4C2A087_EUMVA|nr:hypothetical protein EVAR_66881_1 [Eumeta japonica]
MSENVYQILKDTRCSRSGLGHRASYVRIGVVTIPSSWKRSARPAVSRVHAHVHTYKERFKIVIGAVGVTVHIIDDRICAMIGKSDLSTSVCGGNRLAPLLKAEENPPDRRGGTPARVEVEALVVRNVPRCRRAAEGGVRRAARAARAAR